MIAIYPELASCAVAGEFETLAIRLREYFAGDVAAKPFVNVEAMIRASGIGIARMPMDDFAAILAKDVKGKFEIVFVIRPDVVPGPEYNFLLAHLLGHFQIHVQPQIARGEWTSSGYREAVQPLRRYENPDQYSPKMEANEACREGDADAFASALIMPKGMVITAAQRLGDMNRVAAMFGTTVAAVMRRLEDLDASPRQPSNFVAAERRLQPGGRAHGPADVPPMSTRVNLESLENGPSVPKFLAAKSYSVTGQKTAAPTPAARPSQAPMEATATAPLGKGLAKLRQLAKQLDSSVDT